MNELEPTYFDPSTQSYPNSFDEDMYYVATVPYAWRAGANPHEDHWYEYDEGYDTGGTIAMPGYYLSSDTSPVSGKTYYYLLEEESTMSETAKAYSTYQTYLMYRSSSAGSYAKVVDIKDYPDMIGSPNMLDCTTLSDGMEKRIAGILQMSDGLAFTANYTPTHFSTVRALEGKQYDYALWLGGNASGNPDGHNGKFEWTGDVRAGFSGKGVDEVQDMTITCFPSTDVGWAPGT